MKSSLLFISFKNMPHYASCEYHHPKLMNNTTLVFSLPVLQHPWVKDRICYSWEIFTVSLFTDKQCFSGLIASSLTLGWFYPEHFLALMDRTRREWEVFGLWFSISLSLSPLHYTIQPTSCGSALLTSTSVLEDERTKYCNSLPLSVS